MEGKARQKQVSLQCDSRHNSELKPNSLRVYQKYPDTVVVNFKKRRFCRPNKRYLTTEPNSLRCPFLKVRSELAERSEFAFCSPFGLFLDGNQPRSVAGIWGLFSCFVALSRPSRKPSRASSEFSFYGTPRDGTRTLSRDAQCPGSQARPAAKPARSGPGVQRTAGEVLGASWSEIRLPAGQVGICPAGQAGICPARPAEGHPCGVNFFVAFGGKARRARYFATNPLFQFWDCGQRGVTGTAGRYLRAACPGFPHSVGERCGKRGYQAGKSAPTGAPVTTHRVQPVNEVSCGHPTGVIRHGGSVSRFLEENEHG
jgi:hypothetical protein